MSTKTKTTLCTYAAAAAAWILSMIYECMWNGGKVGAYVGIGAVGLTVLAILFVRTATKRQNNREPRPMEWFLAAALIVAVFYMAVDKASLLRRPHVVLLPMYPILFLDFFGCGCYTWWRKLKDRT